MSTIPSNLARKTYVTAFSTETGATATMIVDGDVRHAEGRIDRVLAAGGNVWDTPSGLLTDDQAEIVGSLGYEVCAVPMARYPETMRLLGCWG